MKKENNILDTSVPNNINVDYLIKIMFYFFFFTVIISLLFNKKLSCIERTMLLV